MESAAKLLPKSLKSPEALTKLGHELVRHVTLTGLSGTIAQRREQARKLYRGENGLKNTSDTPNYCTHTLDSRTNARASSVSQAVTQADPIFLVTNATDNELNQIATDALTDAMGRFNAEDVIRKLVLDSMIEMTSVCKVSFLYHPDGLEQASHTGAFASVMWESIKISDFFAYPNVNVPLNQLITHGHRFSQIDIETKMRIKAGEYLSDSLAGPFRSNEKDTKALESTSTLDADGVYSVMYDLLHRYVDDKGNSETLRVIVTAGGRVLRIEPWPFKFSWYVLFQDSADTDGLYAETGVANSLIGLSLAADVSLNEALRNARKQSRAPVVGPPSLQDDFIAQVDDAYIPTNAPESIQFMPVNDALRGLLPMMQVVLQLADGAASSPALMSGAPDTNPNKTATAASIQQAGFNLAMSNDVTRYSTALIQCARLTLEWLAKYSDIHAEVYKRESSEAEALQQTIKGQLAIQVNGQSPESQPMYRQQVAGQVAGMVAQLAGDIPESVALRAELVYQIIENSVLPDKERAIELANALRGGSENDAEGRRELTDAQTSSAYVQLATQMAQMLGPQGQELPQDPAMQIPPEGASQ